MPKQLEGNRGAEELKLNQIPSLNDRALAKMPKSRLCSKSGGGYTLAKKRGAQLFTRTERNLKRAIIFIRNFAVRKPLRQCDRIIRRGIRIPCQIEGSVTPANGIRHPE